MKRAELLLPAGDLEKLKTAIIFGADAVYLGGKSFSLRAYAGNLSIAEIEEGIEFAHSYGKKVYTAVNVLARNQDFDELPTYLQQLDEIGVDGIIVSDPGVLRIASRYAPDLPITISTQASVCNYETAEFYRGMGVKRIVVARELPLEEIVEIKRRVDIEIEMFIHGAMCVSYSGRCLLSHYMTGRSGNRGECTQPCRYQYMLQEEKRPGEYYPIHEDEKGTYILNSRDLCLIEYIPQLLDAGIDVFKVEGRMKSPLYAASTASVYRSAIDRYLDTNQEFTREEIDGWVSELSGTASRPFTNGFIEGESDLLQDINRDIAYLRTDFCGVVKDNHYEQKMLEIEQRANFGPGEDLELLIPGRGIKVLKVSSIYDVHGRELDRARHPRQRILTPIDEPIPKGSILRRAGGVNR